jgi:polar amino acid transport system substrate-binding protein
VEYSTGLDDSRVLAENYGGNSSMLVVPKDRSERLAYLSQFVEEARASGVLQRAIKKAGQPGYRVADPFRH